MKKEQEEKMPKKGKHKVLRAIGVILIIFLIIVVVAFVAIAWYVNDKLSKIQTMEVNKNEIEITEGVEEELEEYRNIALLGIDSRQDSYGTGNRSDCIIIASINNKTKEISEQKDSLRRVFFVLLKTILL